MRAVVSELVTSAPDVIVARGTSVLNSVRQVTKSIPVAFVGISDPEGVGIVDNVSASPRRNGNHYAPTNFRFSGSAPTRRDSTIADTGQFSEAWWNPL
jgi:putative ABC transport system substrate-binding protein